MLSVIIIKLLLINCLIEELKLDHVAPAIQTCNLPWFQIDTSCYLMPEEDRNMTFAEAKMFCASKNARLPKFNNHEEFKAFTNLFNKWKDLWLGYWYDQNRTLMTFTGFPSGEICDVEQKMLNNSIEKRMDNEKGNCVIRIILTNDKPPWLIYVHENCNAYYPVSCQIPKTSDDCPKIATTTTAMPETQTSPIPNATTEIETSPTLKATSEILTSTMPTVRTDIQKSTISNANTENETSIYTNMQIFHTPVGSHETISPTRGHGKILAKQKDSPSKGKQTIVYIIVPICVIGLLVVIIVVAVLLRRRARKKAASNAISSKLSKKSYPIFSTNSVTDATKVKSQQKTHKKSFIASLQKTLDKSVRKSKVNSLQQTQPKTQPNSHQKTQPILLDDLPEKTRKTSIPYHDISPSIPIKNEKKTRMKTDKPQFLKLQSHGILASKSRSQEAEQESDYETVK